MSKSGSKKPSKKHHLNGDSISTREIIIGPVTMRQYLDAYDLNHDTTLAALLGDLIVAWSAVDRNLVRIMTFALNQDWEVCSGIYFGANSFYARSKLVKVILNRVPSSKPAKTKDIILFPKESKIEICKILDDLRTPNDRRDELVHGSWTFCVETGGTSCANYRRKIDPPPKPNEPKRDVNISKDRIKEDIATVQGLAKKLREAYNSLGQTTP